MNNKNILFLFPHCDDESFVDSIISKRRDPNIELICIFLTKDPNISQKREQESIRVLKMLGVKDENIIFPYPGTLTSYWMQGKDC